jgi:prepilin-type N-terminal cleavage/methylation domain-containing protein
MNKKGFTLIELMIMVAITGILFAIGAKVYFEPTTTTPVVATSDQKQVTKATAKVTVGSDGMTTEQRNIKKRLEEDNKPGVIKHLYLISAYSGQVIFYSTVDGKVTSSSKRISNSVALQRGDRGEWNGDFVVPSMQDDGTYGSSMPYLYWWDTKGVYHQHYVTGGQIVHVSAQPIAVKSVIINMESAN